MIIRVFSIAAIACTALLLRGQADDLSSFPWSRQVSVPSVVSSGRQLPAIKLDSEIYRQLNEKFSNLCLVDKDGAPVPYLLRDLHRWENKTSYTVLPGRIVDFNIDTQTNAAVIDYELSGDGKLLNVGKLEIDPKSKHAFNKLINLEFSDGSSEKNLKFFNHANRVRYSRLGFAFTPRNANKIRIRISPFVEYKASAQRLERTGSKDSFTEQRISSEELDIDRIVFYSVAITPTAAEKLRESVNSIAGEVRPAEKNESKWEFALERHPLDRLIISSDTANYRRKYKLQFSRITDSRTETIKTLRGELTPDSKVIELNGIRADSALLTIENQDNAPLINASFQWVSICKGLVIDPADLARAPFTLYYGGSSAQALKFDLADYIGKFDGMEYLFLTNTPSIENELFDTNRPLAWQKYFKKSLPFLILAAALVLALFSFKTLRKVKSDANPDGDW